MRERKERFWYKHVDEDEIFYQIFTFDEVMNGNQFDFLSDNPMLRGFRMIDDHDEYTGLKDKDGTEIYEGDIISFLAEGDGHTSVVEYDLGGFYVSIGDWAPYIGEVYDYEVIGNIHENPELLEEKS